MISENLYEDLIKSINDSFDSIIEILKCLGNENRIKILITLLGGPQSYGTIVDSLSLKKTAVSNHLSQLLDTNLIEKIDYGVYNITGDGLEFIKAIEKAYHTSPSRQKQRFEALQRRSMSKSFLNRFNELE